MEPRRFKGSPIIIIIAFIAVSGTVAAVGSAVVHPTSTGPDTNAQVVQQIGGGGNSHAFSRSGPTGVQGKMQVGTFAFVTDTPIPLPGSPHDPCDASLQGRCGHCFMEVACRESTSEPICPQAPNNYYCFPQ